MLKLGEASVARLTYNRQKIFIVNLVYSPLLNLEHCLFFDLAPTLVVCATSRRVASFFRSGTMNPKKLPVYLTVSVFNVCSGLLTSVCTMVWKASYCFFNDFRWIATFSSELSVRYLSSVSILPITVSLVCALLTTTVLINQMNEYFGP